MQTPERTRVLGIVQARLSSRRLPRKVLADSGMGEPLLELLLRRLSPSRSLDEVCVATSTEPEDDAIVDLVARLGIRVHRGPLDDTLTRFAEAAAGFDGAIVRITGDCPLIDPQIVDQVVHAYFRGRCSYASNVDPPTFPDGMDCEVFSSAALFQVADEATSARDREHVTPAIRRNTKRSAKCRVTNSVDLSDIRLTVDYEEDLQRIRQVVRALGPRRFAAPMSEILIAAGLAGRLREG